MKLRGPQARTFLAAAVGATVTVGVGLFLHAFQIGLSLVYGSYDVLTVARGDVPADEAALIYLDEVSYDELGAPMNVPLDRRWHAMLVRRLTAAGARAVVFDIVFSDPATQDPEMDEAFAAALRDNGRTLLAAENVVVGPGLTRFFRPFDLLLTNSAGMGSIEMIADPDLVVRQHTPNDRLIAPISQVAVTLGGDKVLAGAEPRWLSYYGPPGFLPWCHFSEALDPEVVADDFFRGKTIFVGSKLFTKAAADRRDEYPTPFSARLTKRMMGEFATPFMPGVELHATAFLNLLRGESLRRFNSRVEGVVLVLIGLMAGGGFLLLRPSRAVMAAFGSCVLLLSFSYLLFIQKGIWFAWMTGVVQILIGAAWAVVFNSVQLYAQKRVLEHTLGLYLSPKLVQKYARNPALLYGEAVTQEATFMFSDIADFTPMSNEMDSKTLAKLMNRYFQAAVSKCVHPSDGTVGKFIGDAIFAFWNAPDAQEDHRLRACQTALRFREHGLHEFEGRRLVTRIGIHTGVATVGNMGSLERVDYTALGESVNLASRLEGLNKHVGTTCLISESTRSSVEDQFTLREIGAFQLKGFATPVTVFELVGAIEEAESTRAWRESFAEGLNAYRTGDWAMAEAGFWKTIERRGEDGPSRLFLARLVEVREEPAPPGWTGAIELTEK